jgi:glycosyltransferase involved in cell wall biosynthesis
MSPPVSGQTAAAKMTAMLPSSRVPGRRSWAWGTSPEGPLRVAWFGHGGGRRADGLSSYSATTVSALRRHGVEVAFFFHRHDGDAVPVAQAISLSAARFKTVTMPSPGTAARIAHELMDFRPDVVHISLSFSLLDTWLLAHCRRAGIPTIATVHLPYARAHSGRGRVLNALYRFHAHTLSLADRCIALSNGQRDLLVAVGCDRDRIDVLPNGVDTNEISPGPSRMRSSLGGRFVVGYMGRLDPEKRVLELVHAFRRRRWSDDDRLVIAGGGSQQLRISRIADHDPRIVMLGAIHDRQECIDLLRGIDVFVLPSTAEGLSLSLLEAMAAGCAVVATDVGDDGALVSGAGLVLPAYPLEPSLGTALDTLRDDPTLRSQLGLLARQRVTDYYSSAVTVEGLMRNYEHMALRKLAVA